MPSICWSRQDSFAQNAKPTQGKLQGLRMRDQSTMICASMVDMLELPASLVQPCQANITVTGDVQAFDMGTPIGALEVAMMIIDLHCVDSQ